MNQGKMIFSQIMDFANQDICNYSARALGLPFALEHHIFCKIR